MIAVGTMNVNLLAFPLDLAKEGCGKHAKHSYDQNSSCCNTQRSQCTDKVYEGEYKYSDTNADQDNHVAHNKIVDGFDCFQGRTSSCSGVGTESVFAVRAS